jgi:hypothetical protein
VSTFILTDAVVEGLVDVAQLGAGAAVEHEVEAGLVAELFGDRLLPVAQDRRLELDVAGLVDAVHIAEGRGEHVAAALDRAERARHADHVLRGRVQLLGGGALVIDAVLFTTDDAGLDLEDHLELGALAQQLLGDLHVLVERQGRAVEHVRLEQVRPDPRRGGGGSRRAAGG